MSVFNCYNKIGRIVVISSFNGLVITKYHFSLSRVRTLDGVALLDLVASKIKASTFVEQEMARLQGVSTGQE